MFWQPPELFRCWGGGITSVQQGSSLFNLEVFRTKARPHIPDPYRPRLSYHVYDVRWRNDEHDTRDHQGPGYVCCFKPAGKPDHRIRVAVLEVGCHGDAGDEDEEKDADTERDETNGCSMAHKMKK